jgi:hypothetical protein
MREKTSPWLKVFALCTAIGLGGTYVWRQQKAALEKTKTDERLVLSSSKSAIIVSVAVPAAQEEPDRVLMPSSKSSTFKLEQEERTLMPSSKIGIIQLKPEEAKERVLLPGSKSIPMPIFRQRSVAPEDPPKPDEP